MHKIGDFMRAFEVSTSPVAAAQRKQMTMSASLLVALSEAANSLISAREAKGDGATSKTLTFEEVIYVLYPCVIPRHLDTFRYWVYKSRRHEDLMREGEAFKEAEKRLAEKEEKPPLTPSERFGYERLFVQLDSSKDGVLDAWELVENDYCTADGVQAVMDEFDISGDGRLDLEEFVCVMAVLNGYQPPRGHVGEGLRALYSEWLTNTRLSIQHHAGKDDVSKVDTPQQLRPVPNTQTMIYWCEQFDKMDGDKDGEVTLKELRETGAFEHGEMQFIIQHMDTNRDQRVSMVEFLNALARSRGWRENCFEELEAWGGEVRGKPDTAAMEASANPWDALK